MTAARSGPAGQLPIRPRPVAGEKPASYVRRLARANHLRPKYLQGYLRKPGGEAGFRLDWLAVLAGRSVQALERAFAAPAGGRGSIRVNISSYTRQADKPALFAAIRCDAAGSRLSISALADKYAVGRRIVRQALASPVPAPRKVPEGRRSRLDPFKAAIGEMLQEEAVPADSLAAATRWIFGRLTAEHAMTGVSARTLYRHLRTLLPPGKSPLLIFGRDDQRPTSGVVNIQTPLALVSPSHRLHVLPARFLVTARPRWPKPALPASRPRVSGWRAAGADHRAAGPWAGSWRGGGR